MGSTGSNPCPAAHRAKRSHRSSYMRLVEGLLGAAASLETSSEKPAALYCRMRASMRADGTTFRLRHTSGPVGTEDLDGRKRLEGVPHKDEVGVETTTDSVTRGL